MSGFVWVGIPAEGGSHAVPVASHADPEEGLYDLACDRVVAADATGPVDGLVLCPACLVAVGMTIADAGPGSWRE